MPPKNLHRQSNLFVWGPEQAENPADKLTENKTLAHALTNKKHKGYYNYCWQLLPRSHTELLSRQQIPSPSISTHFFHHPARISLSDSDPPGGKAGIHWMLLQHVCAGPLGCSVLYKLPPNKYKCTKKKKSKAWITGLVPNLQTKEVKRI